MTIQTSRGSRISCPCALAALGAALLAPAPLRAADILTIGVKDGWVLPLKITPVQISISDSDIADVKLIQPRRLLVNAKRLGQARVILIDRNNRIVHYLINVTVPISGLVVRLRQILPHQNIKLQAIGNTVVISGDVDSALAADQAGKMVAAHIKGMGSDAKVLNFLTVRGRQQVQLRVKVAEVSRSGLRQVGVNAWYRGSKRAGGLLSPGTSLDGNLAPDLGSVGNSLQPGGGVTPGVAGTMPPLPMLTSPFSGSAYGLLFSTQDSASFPVSIALNLLQGQGLAKVISEPTVVAFSGQEASFLAGGEFPIPVPQGLGQTGIEFKKYGVQLAFTPTVLAEGNVRMKVSVTVSERDQSAAVTIQGTTVPGLSARHSETTVHLKSGQSFAVAGLLQDRIESSTTKIPLLGDIPIVGMFFRRSQFSRSETELVIVVTVDVVSPVKSGEMPPLPGEEELADPGALRFFLLGTTDARDEIDVKRGPAGPVGFSE